MNKINNSPSNQLIINLSILFSQPTGISNYAKSIFPYLKSLNPTLLTATAQNYSDFNYYPVPNNLTPADGTKGHLNRLVWTQFQLPKIYQNLKSQLLFSPIPEAPLYTNCRFIVTAFDMIPLRFPKRLSPLTTYHKYYTPEVFKQAEHIICISESTANDITQFYQIPSNKITSIALAGDNSHFQFLNLPTRNYFLYIGRQDPYKNLPRLITAFSALPNRNDYELWLAGPYDKRYSPLLEERKTTIVNGVQDAEDRLNEAQKRLEEAKKQLNQANLVISEIKNETITTKKRLLESDAFQAKKDLTVRFERALATFRSKERQIFVEIKQQIISLVLQRTVSRAQETFKSQERATALINETINKLEGDLL